MDGPDADRERLDATVHGYVQGVGFRVWVARIGSRAGLSGWVRNEPDGSVRCVAEGPRADLEDLLARLRSGPTGASVDRVDARFGAAAGGFDGFHIRPGGHAGD